MRWHLSRTTICASDADLAYRNNGRAWNELRRLVGTVTNGCLVAAVLLLESVAANRQP